MQINRGVLVGVVILAVVIYALRAKKETPREITSAPAPIDDRLAKIAPEESDRILKISRRIQTERGLLLKRTPLEIVDGKATIPFSIRVKRTCYAGDGNAIKEDLRRDPLKKLYLTFESVDGGKEIYPSELSKSFLEGGETGSSFKVPVTDKPKQYGVYLCTSSSGGNCGSKPHLDINDVFMDQLNHPNATPPDRAFFFQYALVDADGMATFSEFPASDQVFTGLNQYLSQERGLSDVEKATNHTKEWTQNLNNLPLTTGNGKLGIELPLAAPVEECLGKK